MFPIAELLVNAKPAYDAVRGFVQNNGILTMLYDSSRSVACSPVIATVYIQLSEIEALPFLLSMYR